jgi:hypothetical protein
LLLPREREESGGLTGHLSRTAEGESRYPLISGQELSPISEPMLDFFGRRDLEDMEIKRLSTEVTIKNPCEGQGGITADSER